MDKPKKREVQEGRFEVAKFEAAMWNDGYNKAIDDYELWLKESASIDKLGLLIYKTLSCLCSEIARENWTAKHHKTTTKQLSAKLAERIHKLIGK